MKFLTKTSSEIQRGTLLFYKESHRLPEFVDYNQTRGEFVIYIKFAFFAKFSRESLVSKSGSQKPRRRKISFSVKRVREACLKQDILEILKSLTNINSSIRNIFSEKRRMW